MLLTKTISLLRFGCSNRFYSKLVSKAQVASASDFSFDYYDVIGFDLDHTICKYKLRALFTLQYNAFAQFIVDKYDYPRYLLHNKITSPFWAQKGLILDKARGNFLKLDENLRILQAYHGTSQLSETDLISVYGEEKKWEACEKLPDSIFADNYLQEPFFVFKDHFTSVGAFLCASMVDVIDKRTNYKPIVYSFFEHFLDALQFSYNRGNFSDGTDHYYRLMKISPEMYIEKCSLGVKEWLRNLKNEKKVFLLTGSNADILNFLATFCLGEDWASYFDLTIAYAKKPGFFIKPRPFFAVENFKETHKIPYYELKSSTIYSQGNSADLNKLFCTMTGLESPKVLYVGDSIFEDVYAASRFESWDAVAIVDEMLAETDDTERHLLNSHEWGSFFGMQDSDEITQTLWASIISGHSKIAVPHLDALSNISMGKKIQCFTSTAPFAGYFPKLHHISS